MKEWFSAVNRKMAELESRIDRELTYKGEREREINELKVKVAFKERELDILKKEIKEMVLQASKDRQKNNEMENRLVKLENKEIEEIGEKQSRKENERGDENDLITLVDGEREDSVKGRENRDNRWIEVDKDSSEEEVWITDRDYLKEIPDALSKSK